MMQPYRRLGNSKFEKMRRLKKKQLDVKRELGNCRLALEERQQAFRERMVFNAQSHNSFPLRRDQPKSRS